jgi:hypothetical protein
MDDRNRTIVAFSRGQRVALPIAAELALLGTCLMAIGVLGPWLVGSYRGSRGLDVGDGDGALVLVIAAASILAIFNPFRTRLTGTGICLAALAGIALAVCLVHLKQLTGDDVPAGWGLYVAAGGSAVVVLAGLRIAAWRDRAP